MQHCLFGRLICEICDSGNGCFERICIKGSGCFDIRQFFLHGANYKCPWRKNRYQSRRFVPSSRWNISLPCVRSGWQRGVVKEVLWRKHRRCGPVPYTARGPALRMYIITGGSWQSRSDAWGNWLPTSYVLVMFFLANMVSKSIELCAQVVLSNGASIFVPLVTWPENLLNIFLVLHGHSRSPVHSKLAPCSGPVISCASHLKIFLKELPWKTQLNPQKLLLVVLWEDAKCGGVVVSEASLIRHPEGEWHQGALPKAQVISTLMCWSCWEIDQTKRIDF